MSEKYIISIDQSTQGTKAMIIGRDGRVADSISKPHRQIITPEGWVEHDPVEIASNLIAMVKEMVQNTRVPKRDIAGVAVANQRETVAVWDRKTGKPAYNAIVWQCNRAVEQCRRIENAGEAEHVRRITGLKMSPFFSGPKIAWILENVKGVKEAAGAGELVCGTMDTWVIWTLTGGKSHKTDCSNASRTMLMDLRELNWSEEVCRMFGIPMGMLPEICDSDALYGYTDFDGLFDEPLPIHSAIGDSNSCLYAQGCFEPGSCSAGFGTGTGVIMNIGDSFKLSENGLLTAVCWKTARGGVKYDYDAVVNYCGAVITWLYKDLGLISSPAETEILAEQADQSDRTVLVPAFTGIGAPYWSDASNAVFWGMSRTTKKAELVKACLESMAFQVADVLSAMKKDCGLDISGICCSGGPAKNAYLMKFLGNILNAEVSVPSNEEMTCLGTAFLCGEALGIMKREDLGKAYSRRKFTVDMAEDVRKAKTENWNTAIRQALFIR